MLKGISWEGKKGHFKNKEVPLIEKYFKMVKMEQIQNLLFLIYKLSMRVWWGFLLLFFVACVVTEE